MGSYSSATCGYANVEHVHLLNTCRTKSIFDAGYRRPVEHCVHMQLGY